MTIVKNIKWDIGPDEEEQEEYKVFINEVRPNTLVVPDEWTLQQIDNYLIGEYWFEPYGYTVYRGEGVNLA